VGYLDPPYNQHSYLSNYHIWETIALGDEPEVFGKARKRLDCQTRKSPFNSRRTIADALRRVIDTLDVATIVLSFSDEGFLAREVGCKTGIHGPTGDRVGTIGRLRNTEMIFIAGRGAERLRAPEPAAA